MSILVLDHATVLDADGQISRDARITVENGTIARVEQAAGSPPNCELIDCSGAVVTPGLVNLHTHSPMVLFRGLAEDIDIDRWFNECIWPYESQLRGDDIYWGARLAALEMVDNGVTAFADHYFGEEQIAQAVTETGIRCDLAPTIFGLAPDAGERVAEVATFIEKNLTRSPLLSYRMGPHAPYTCPPPILKSIVESARELGVGLHIHVSETEAQVDESEKQYGASPFGRLHTAGAFDLNLIVAHGLWVKESDLKYMRSNTWFAASPKTYMKLAMGEGGLWQYWRQLNLATGTDGAASSNTQSPLEQLRLFGLIGKQRFGADRFTVPELWRILMAGHDALGFHTGRVAAGYQADLVVWDLEQPNTAPVHNPMAAIIYSADARNVRDVVVHGKVLKRNVELTGGTRPEVLRRASEAAREIVVRGKGTAKVTY